MVFKAFFGWHSKVTSRKRRGAKHDRPDSIPSLHSNLGAAEKQEGGGDRGEEERRIEKENHKSCADEARFHEKYKNSMKNGKFAFVREIFKPSKQVVKKTNPGFEDLYFVYKLDLQEAEGGIGYQICASNMVFMGIAVSF